MYLHFMPWISQPKSGNEEWLGRRWWKVSKELIDFFLGSFSFATPWHGLHATPGVELLQFLVAWCRPLN